MNHTERTARTQSPKTGIFATLRGLPPANGSGAPSAKHRPSKLMALAAATALVTLAAGVSLASGAAPVLTIEEASSVTATTAKAKGSVDPADHATTYRFQYATEAQFEASEWGEAASAGEDTLAEGAGTNSVEATLENLQPGTTYHIRLFAENSEGETVEAVAPSTFATPVIPPTIDATFVSEIGATEVLLQAKVDPGGASTTVHFEYLTQRQFEENEGNSEPPFTGSQATPESALIGDDNGDHLVSSIVTGLAPHTTYRYRAMATNQAAPAGIAGPDQALNTYATPILTTDCPNQAFRTGPSANLPDCRAYEMVSPVDKQGADAKAVEGSLAELDQSSISGEQFTYSAYRAFGDAVSNPYSSQYIASRGADGWSSHGISPPRTFSRSQATGEFKAFSPDLSNAWLVDGASALTPDAISQSQNIYERDNASGAYQALTTLAPINGETGLFPEFQGASSDGAHAIFTANRPLTPAAPGGEGPTLYEWFAGAVRPVAVLRGGEPAPGESSAGTHNEPLAYGIKQSVDHAISDDGSRIFWSTAPSPLESGRIFVRIDNGEPDARTVAISESVSNSNAQFWMASADGSRAIFTINEVGNTGNHAAGNGVNAVSDLYEFDVDSETPTLIAHGVSGVLGASEDASYLYFVSREALTPGATPGEPNLYLHHNATMTFIATLPSDAEVSATSGDGVGGTPRPISTEPDIHTARVTPDGLHALFVTQGRLTDYNNLYAITGEPAAEVYLFDAAADGGTGRLVCVSCNPSGARPEAHAAVLLHNAAGQEYLAAAYIPGWKSQLYDGHVLSDDGARVFFDSFDALAPQDTNGAQDVYEWQALGAGPNGARCTEESASFSTQDDGCLSLISTGKSLQPSELIDVSPSAADVFIRTASSIDPRDPGLADIYDAREAGGFPPAPNPSASCEGEACQTPPAPPNDHTPASLTYDGSGNVAGRPTRKARQKKHQKKRHHGKSHKRAANHDRRMSR